jgi:hypothetical protein
MTIPQCVPKTRFGKICGWIKCALSLHCDSHRNLIKYCRCCNNLNSNELILYFDQSAANVAQGVVLKECHTLELKLLMCPKMSSNALKMTWLSTLFIIVFINAMIATVLGRCTAS